MTHCRPVSIATTRGFSGSATCVRRIEREDPCVAEKFPFSAVCQIRRMCPFVINYVNSLRRANDELPRAGTLEPADARESFPGDSFSI